MRSRALPHNKQEGVRETLRQSEGWEPKCLALPMLEGFGLYGKPHCAALMFRPAPARSPLAPSLGAVPALLPLPQVCAFPPAVALPAWLFGLHGHYCRPV